MGLGDIVSRVITKYEVDNKDALKGNKRMEVSLGQVAAAAGATVGAYKALSAGLDTLQRNTRLAASTAGADIQGLRDATAGLADDTRLLEFASKAMNGTFKLSQREMEQALQGALALRKTLGVDLTTALERTQKAITEGTTEPLKELGLVIKGPENDTKEGLQAALAALGQQAQLAGDDLGNMVGDETQRAAVKFENSMDSLKEALGRVAVAMTPIIEALAQAVGFLADIDAISSNIAGTQSRSELADSNAMALEARRRQRLKNKNFWARQKRLGMLPQGMPLNDFGTGSMLMADQQEPGSGVLYDGPRPTLSGGRRRRGRGGGGGYTPFTTFLAPPPGPANQADALGGYVEGSRGAQSFIAEDLDAGQQAIAKLRADMEAMAAIDQFNQGLIDGLFGAPGQINETAAALDMLSQSFNTLTGAAAQGMGAWIDGSKSASEASKDAIGQGLKAMAMDMTVKALSHGAAAIGSLAFGNVPAAATHGKAAAAYAAGAAVAAVTAKELGWGTSQATGAAGSAGAGSAGVAPSSLGGGGDTTSTRVYILDGSLGGQSPRLREANIRKSMRQAGVKIDGDVVFDG